MILVLTWHSQAAAAAPQAAAHVVPQAAALPAHLLLAATKFRSELYRLTKTVTE